MKYRLLGPTGLRVSELCLGAMTFGEADEAAGAVRRFGEAGGNFIDTANAYGGGRSETMVGEAVKAERERWVLATKYALTTDPTDPNAGGAHRKSLRRAVEDSLKRLGTDYIDLYWVHFWDAFTPVEEVVSALDDLVRSGKVLYLGISDTPAWLVSRAVTMAEERGLNRFAALQVPYSLAQRTVERELLPMARALDLAVTVWAPLAQGLLTGRFGSDRTPPPGTRRSANDLSAAELSIVDTLNSVADARGVPAHHVALAWVLAQQRRAVTIPIIGVRSAEQLAGNLAAVELELTEAELATLNQASRVEPGFPGDFLGGQAVNGEQFALIDDHRGTVDPLYHPAE